MKNSLSLFLVVLLTIFFIIAISLKLFVLGGFKPMILPSIAPTENNPTLSKKVDNFLTISSIGLCL